MSIVNSLNGCVHSQGIKISHKAWLDIGSEEWQNTTEQQKSYAYQAAKLRGWTDQGLKALIIQEFQPRIDEFMAELIVEELREFGEKYPLEIIGEQKKGNNTFMVNGEEICQQEES